MSGRNITPELLDKERQALELRRGGATYDQIAQVIGYATPQGAYLAYQRALKRTLSDAGSEELREMELDRLDRLQQAVWPKALSGDMAALDRVLKIMNQRANYLGLYAPVRAQIESVIYEVTDIDRAVGELRRLLESTGSQPPVLGTGESETGATS